MKRKFIWLLFFCNYNLAVYAQVTDTMKWWDPVKNSFPVIEGQAWANELKNPYDRLPARAEKLVREPVWNLSHDAAGEHINFITDAKRIIVRYVVENKLQMPHFPATGVSGVDLYSINSDGGWNWASGAYNFGDTIVYRYNNLELDSTGYKKGREFRLYLPLYNSIRWLEVGVPPAATLTPLPIRKEKPIVIYGTSIAQGGCASRPGMGWTSILERRLDHRVINLAFSGNGRLEKEIIDMMAEIDAKAYVLDCLPNLTNTTDYPLAEVKKRLMESVRLIRMKHPGVPIILTDYAILTGLLNAAKIKTVKGINAISKEAFSALQAEGIKDLYTQEIKLEMDDTVDGTHPNDIGMEHYAAAYEKNLRIILQEPVGIITTTEPRIQYRDIGTYDWKSRHNELLALNQSNPPKITFFGNSITHYWGGIPKEPKGWGADSWNEILEPKGVRNFGFGWDRIENVLWRVYHGELDGFKALQVVLMIGTNNLQNNTNQEIIDGLEFLIKAIKFRQPDADILLMGLLPRRDMEPRVGELNKEIMKLSKQSKVHGAETGNLFLKNDGKINEELFRDGLHPNAAGYKALAGFLKSRLK
ncbi:MAG: SGNH/GDSL hydrolase family protein [Chitinophagaceae bacterium]